MAFFRNRSGRVKSLAVFVFLGLITILLATVMATRDGALLAADGEGGKRSKVKPERCNVRVLPDFKAKSYIDYQHELSRSPHILAVRVLEQVANEQMPPAPMPGYKSVAPSQIKGPRPKLLPTVPVPSPPRPEVYELWPIAWSLKAVNLEHAFLPQLKEEVVVLVRFTPEYFKEGAFSEGTWVLACLETASHPEDPAAHKAPGVPAYDTASLWYISDLPYVTNPDAPPESFQLYRKPTIKCFKNKPTLEQVAQFVESTNFGNNNIFPHTSAADEKAVEVMQVVVYHEYSSIKLFQEGLPQKITNDRKAVYAEEFRRSKIWPN